MPFWQCYYHLIWATKGRQPTINLERERIIFKTVWRVSQDLGGQILAVNGTDDHILIAAALPPRIAVAQFVKLCKGALSRMVNEAGADAKRFAWQSGYGVLTFGQKALPFVVGYVNNQKQHHASNHLESYLEQME